MIGTLLIAAAAAASSPSCLAQVPASAQLQGAWGKDWYINADKLELFDATYVKYGLPRLLRPGDVAYAAEYNGVAVGLDSRGGDREVIYLLTNVDECEFQPYQIEPDWMKETPAPE